VKKPILAAALLLSLAAGPLASTPALAVGSETPPSVQATETSAPAAGTTGATAETDPATAAATDPVTDPVTDPATGPVTGPATEAATDPATDPVTDPAAPEPPSDPQVTDPPATGPAVTDPAVTDPAPDPEPEFVTAGGIGAKWRSLGGAGGVLGEPTSNERCSAGLCVQTFTGGSIYWTSKWGAHPVLLASGRTGPQWTAGGGLAAFGYPIGDEILLGSRSLQKFSTGKVIIWTGTRFLNFSTRTGIGSRWAASGAETVLGLPSAGETCGLRNGGCSQVFDRGTIYWSPQTRGQVIRGGIGSRWRAAGAQNGVLGYPTTTEACGQVARGCLQRFQGGSIYWSSATGAWITRGGIGSRYILTGGNRSSLGYPVANEACRQAAGGCIQRFQGGTIYWSPATPAWIVRAGIAHRYATNGGAGGWLGYPTANEKCAGDQCIQSFQRGFIGYTKAAGTRAYGITECQKLNNGRSRYSTYGANRVLLTFTQGYGQSYATNVYCVRMAGTYVQDWRTDGYVGASGFKAPGVPSGPTRYLYSPTGSYSVTEAFGLGNPGTALPYRTLNPRSRWGGNPWTATYNKYFESSSWVGWDENMWYFATRATHDYRQGVVVNYNRPNIVQDAGFAIFLHMNKVPTAGCISLDDWAVVDYIRKSRPGDRIIMGTYSALFR
jgi:L,D-peptidoglycan transpeptidase YkuD (ErfK/YbiS/YcfS/YnhG family)